jgi:hypothetical protein
LKWAPLLSGQFAQNRSFSLSNTPLWPSTSFVA